MIAFTRGMLMLLLAFSSLGCFKAAFAKEVVENLKLAPEPLVIFTGSGFPVKTIKGGDKVLAVAYLVQDSKEHIGKTYTFDIDRLYHESQHHFISPLGKMANDLEEAVDILKTQSRGKRYVPQRPRPCLFKICSMMGKRPNLRPNYNI